MAAKTIAQLPVGPGWSFEPKHDASGHWPSATPTGCTCSPASSATSLQASPTSPPHWRSSTTWSSTGNSWSGGPVRLRRAAGPAPLRVRAGGRLSRPRPPRRTLLAAGRRGVSDDAAMTTRKRDARSHRRNWTTIAVTPCPPGWGIVYDIRGIRDDDDTADYEIRPCPAILLQELRTTSVYVTTEGEVETITHEPPYDTRVVFADHEDGVLRPVDEVSNFVRALGPRPLGRACGSR